jgi:hypothetical protein
MLFIIRKLFFSVALIFNFSFGISQINSGYKNQAKFDSIVQQFKKDSTHLYRFQKIRPYLNLDNRNSFIRKEPVNVRGFQLGFVVFNRHTTGLGYYTINDESSRNVKSIFENQEVLITTRLDYFTLFYQYAIVSKRFFEIDIPFEVGLGKFDLSTKIEISERIVLQRKGWFTFFGSGIKAVVKPVKHIGVSGIIGYRFAEDIFTNINFNGMYYSLGIWIDIRKIYRDTRFYLFMRPNYRRALKKL